MWAWASVPVGGDSGETCRIRRDFMGLERRTVHFVGRVQGVGFRYTTKRLAADYDVTGFVKNLPDGRVQLVAEGEVKEIDHLVEAVQREMTGNIHATQVDRKAYQGAFVNFDIAY